MIDAVEIDSLTVAYGAAGADLVTAVDALSLTVPAGQVFGLLGPHGAGKTSLLRVLACLDEPAAGSVRLNGYDATRERAMAARQVGAVLEGAPRVDLDGSDEQSPPILLLDERAWEEERLRSRIAALCAPGREGRKTVVLATRDAGLAKSLCDRVVIMDRGRLVADITVAREADLWHEAYYEIEVKGRLDGRRVTYFEGLDVTAAAGSTTISGLVADQAALHGLLAKVRDLGLPLLSVRRSGPDLEGILSRLGGR